MGVGSGKWRVGIMESEVESAEYCREEREWRVEWGECRMRNGKRRGES